MRSVSIPSQVLGVIIPIALSVVFGMIIMESTALAVGVLALMVILFMASRNILEVLAILILLLPFSSLPVFAENIIELPGAKPLQLIGALVAGFALLNYRNAVPMTRQAKVFIALLLVIFTITVARSLLYLDTIIIVDGEVTGAREYIFSDYLKPLVFVIPMFVIVKFGYGPEQVTHVLRTLFFSLILLSLYVLYTYFFEVPDKLNLRATIEFTETSLGLHKNAIAAFFVIGFPIVLSHYFVRKTTLTLIGMWLCVGAIGFLYSRTAYVTVLLSFVAYLFISGRARLLPVLLIIGLGLSFVVSSTIIERASTGIETEDANAVSAGRLDRIWLPLVEEISKDPVDVMFGRGRYGMITTSVHEEGVIRGASHPHNMYIEAVVDSGAVGLIIFLALFGLLLQRTYRSIPRLKDPAVREYQYGILISLVMFMLSGLTGRSFFPAIENSFLWIVIAVAFVTIRLADQGDRNAET